VCTGFYAALCGGEGTCQFGYGGVFNCFLFTLCL
jgi:hypothetical protein